MSLRRHVAKYKDSLRRAALDLDAPGARARARWHFMFFDHGWIRSFWTNFAQIAPGVYRSNHPSPARLEQYAHMGIRSILNLRGASTDPHSQFETEACARLGLTLVDIAGLSARRAPEADVILDLIDIMRRVEKPFLFHCKSGADRSSLIAAVYLLAIEKAPLSVARKQFSIRFIHFQWTQTGILDHILNSYETAQAATGIAFEDWIKTGYDASRLQAEFDAARR